MAVIQKTLFPENLDRYNTFIQDTDANSKYFKITELPDTFTGGKNAFLIQGSEFLVADTLIKIELKDSSGNTIYHEPGEGIISSSLGGDEFITEYYEGVSKVVAVYIYPETAYGPCTLTILGEASTYDNNGLIAPVPLNWQGQYNVKWQKQINVNPSLANTTKIRFYKRPTATISEIVSPVYRIDTNTGQKINSGINQSFANIKLSKLETFAGDVKRIKVFRTSLGDISDYDMIQDILVESKELLTSYALTGSVVGNTGILTSETFKNYWITGSLQATLDSNRVEAGAKLKGAGNFIYSASLDLKSANTYEINLDAFYSASTNSNLGIYIGCGSYTSSIGTLTGTNPTKNLLDTTIPFKLDEDCTNARLFFSQSQGEWHLGNISLKLSQDTAFSPDEVSFVTTMPSVIGNEDFNFKFEFYDVNNNYVPVAVTQSANFTGGSNAITKLLTFESDRTAFRFSTGSYANPPNQNVRFKTIKTNFTGSITYASSAFDVGGTYIEPTSYAGTYPGWFTSQNDNGALLNIASFSGSVNSVLVGSIVYTASCEGFTEYETIYRFEDGDNAPGVFVTANTNQFIYKATDLSLNPTGQVITIEAKRKNLASATTPLTVNSGSGKPPLTLVSTNATNGVDTYTLAGSSYSYGVGESIYYISGSDQFGNQFSDSVKISPVKILDGLSATLTNDNASLPALSNGFVASGSFVLTSGSVTVKVGNESISFDDDNDSVRANNTFAITNVSGTGCTPNTGNNSNPTTNAYGITNLTADSGSLDITISYKDGAGDTTSIVKTATYTKNKKAAPVLRLEATPKDQSVSAKSTGEQVDSFSNVTISVKETYNGATSTLTITSLTATSSDITSISTTAGSGLVTLSGKTLANGTNATTIAISAVVTDSEGVSRTLTDTLSLSKVKKATPNVEGQISPNAQTVTANSDGSNTATPTSLTVKALEGGTTRLTSVSAVGSGVTIGTIAYNGSSPYNYATIPLSSVSSDTATVTVTINYTDSEGNTGSKTAIATISKAKKASPVVVISANPQSQTVPATAAGLYTAPSTIAISVNEGGSTYSYGSGNSTFTITNVTNGTNSSGTITPNTPTTSAGVAGVITLSYTNSEGTTITGKTINFSVGVAVQGSNGADGGAGPGVVYRGEWANSTIYYKTATRVDVVSYVGSYYLTNATHTSVTGNATTGQPGVGSNWTSFGAQYSSVATDVLLAQDSTITRGLVMGTLGSYSGFIRSANATSLIAGKGFYLDVDGKVRFGDPSAGYIYFDGTDVNIAGAVKIGSSALIDGVASSTVKTGAASGATAQQNNSAKTAGSVGGWTITSAAIYKGTLGADDTFTTNAGDITIGAGWISAKEFKISSTGAASFKGNITGASGTFSGTVQVGGTNLTAADLLRSSTNVTDALGYTPPTTTQVNDASKTSGYVGGWTINSTSIYTGTEDHSGYTTDGITLYGGGSIHAKQFYIDTSGNAFFKGDVTGASGTFGGSVSIGTAPNIFKADSNGIYLGNATFAAAPFRVSMAGALTASSANITGGSITIGSNFSVDSSGNVNATNANLTGTITATAGTIGGWQITGTGYLINSTGKLKINPATPAIEIYDNDNAKRLDIHYGSLTYLGASNVYIDPPAISLPNIDNMVGNFDSGYVYSAGSSFYVGQAGTYQKQVTWQAIDNVGYISNTGNSYLSIGRGVEIRDGSGNVVGNMYAPGGSSNYFSGGGEYIQWPSYLMYASLTFPSSGTYYAYTYYYYYGYLQIGVTADINGNYWDEGAKSLDMENNLVEITDAGIQIAKNPNQYLKFPRDYGTTIVDGKGVANFTGNSATDYAIRCMNTENDGGGNLGDAMYLYSLDRAVYISNGSLWLATNAAYKPGGGSWSNTASDRRVKQYENELSGSLDMIKALKPKTFEFKNQERPEIERGTQIGFIAQDIEEVRPEWVQIASHKSGSADITAIDPTYYEENKSGSIDIKTISFGTDMTAILVGAIKELTTKVEQLEARLSGSI
jgi:hypothetical protein